MIVFIVIVIKFMNVKLMIGCKFVCVVLIVEFVIVVFEIGVL